MMPGIGENCNVYGYGITLSNSNFQIDFNNVWSNDNISEFTTSGIEINYSGANAGVHEISIDPIFADGVLYLLRTQSPCIDSGDPASDYFREPLPNGGRINMGAYGSTPHACTNGRRQQPDLGNWFRVDDVKRLTLLRAQSWFTADLKEYRQVPLQRHHSSLGRIFRGGIRRGMTCNATEPAFMSA